MARISDLDKDEILDMLGDCDMWSPNNSALGNGAQTYPNAIDMGPTRYGDEYVDGYSRRLLFYNSDKTRCVLVGIVEE